MSVLSKISFYRGIRDDIPNQELARELAETKNTSGVQEIAEHLWDKNANVRSDCLKVLYETGYIDPELIAPHVQDFLKLLISKENRLVWGAMIALSTLAALKPAELFEKRELICKTIDQGSVITQDGGIKTLSQVAAADPRYQKELSPYLMNFLRKCRPSDVPRHAEFIQVSVSDFNKAEFTSILQDRAPEMSPAQSTRLKRLLKKIP
jgi:hypothetical protein